MTSAKQGNRTRRILIVRLSAHGDVVQTLPLLAAIKQLNPDIRVGWLVERAAAPLLEGHPLIDDLHICDRKRWLQSLRTPGRWLQTIREMVTFICSIQTQKYDYAVDVQGLMKSAIWPVITGIPRRLGYKRTREWAWLCYTQKLPYHDLKNPDIRTIDKFREFLVPLGLLPQGSAVDDYASYPAPAFPMPVPGVQTQSEVRLLLQSLPTQGPRIALAPTTAWRSKMWPQDYWQALISHLLAQSGVVILIGSPVEQAFIQACIPEERRSHPGLINLAGKTSLPVLLELLKACDVLIGSDSAPLHMANAIAQVHYKPRIVGLYGPTSVRRTGPIGEQHQTLSDHLPCQPCFERKCPLLADKSQDAPCMRAVSVDTVLSAVDAALV